MQKKLLINFHATRTIFSLDPQSRVSRPKKVLSVVSVLFDNFVNTAVAV